MAQKNHNHTSIQQELCRDFNTLKRLSRKQQLIFLWDYYKLDNRKRLKQMFQPISLH